MEQAEFLEKNVFIDLKNLNEGDDKDTVQYFSETDFEVILERVEHFGIGIYKIESWLNGEVSAVSTHEDSKKKATEPKWYKRAFMTSKSRESGLLYSATYKVSNKLLAKSNSSESED